MPASRCEQTEASRSAAIVIGGIPPARCEQTEAFARALRRSGRYETIYLTGHSLGGCVASYVGLANGIKVHCFNPGATPHDKIASALVHATTRADGDVHVHRIGTDLFSDFVSSSSSRVKVHTYNKPLNGSSHGIHQFTGIRE